MKHSVRLGQRTTIRQNTMGWDFLAQFANNDCWFSNLTFPDFCHTVLVQLSQVNAITKEGFFLQVLIGSDISNTEKKKLQLRHVSCSPDQQQGHVREIPGPAISLLKQTDIIIMICIVYIMICNDLYYDMHSLYAT